MSFTQILYHSTACSAHPHGSDLAILREALARNPVFDVTGFLIRRGAEFVQVLEGSEPDVRHIYAMICEDDRHRDVVCHLDTQVPEREFASWAMGYSDLSAEYRDLSAVVDELVGGSAHAPRAVIELMKEVASQQIQRVWPGRRSPELN